MDTKVIIFCGHDMSGKTNIIDELIKQPGYLRFFKFKSSKEKAKGHNKYYDFQYGVEMITQMTEQGSFSVVFDRFHPCEYAYGNTFGRLINEEKIINIDERMAKLGAKIVYCYKSPEFYLEDEDDLIKVEQYETVKKYYEEFFELTKCDVLRLCTDDHDLEKQIKTITEWLEC